ncbi:GNAT family N-acetyltransferase [Chelatococcus sambhunathii]|uniref:GNAT family N-acetyltransferase n=1 Tax=Chelatococcus sambhunathii TaxID=363953 RepID=A0ABU1DBB6_9HYPH|nr:GNAT family N-acetyltransferase [Chelatococcus sambhunathii]MDR4305329.1 GNAT family N-acetyltransferase [Chelatococcus sambhunathii]
MPATAPALRSDPGADAHTQPLGALKAESGRPVLAFETVEVHADVSAVADLWDELRGDALSTPYQSPGFLGPWARHVAFNEGFQPAVVVARDAEGRATALVPLGVRIKMGVRVARFMGGTHVNYNLPVIRRDRLAAFDGGEVRRLLTEAARALALDAFALCNQPYVWEGDANPFAALPRQPSPDAGFCGPLAASLDDHLKLFMSAKSRSNQRRKMRRFEERGRPLIYRADQPDQRARLLDAYFVQKGQQFAARGIPNVFERPGVHAFLEQAAAVSGGKPVIDLYGFDLDDEVIAVTGGVTDGARYCGMFISITSGEHAKYSPGEMLMNFVVEDSIVRGIRTFDLGVGAATYKKMYCPNEEPLFDSIFGVTAKGKAAAAAFSAMTDAKARIKSTPWAYQLAQRIRKLRSGRDETASGADA